MFYRFNEGRRKLCGDIIHRGETGGTSQGCIRPINPGISGEVAVFFTDNRMVTRNYSIPGSLLAINSVEKFGILNRNQQETDKIAPN